jgi:Mor family transcriptional regulator
LSLQAKGFFIRYNSDMSDHGGGNVEEFYIEKVPVLGTLIKWMKSNDMDYAPMIAAVSFSLLVLSLTVFGVSFGQVLSVFFALTPVWLPIMLFFLFFSKWMDMVGRAFYLSQGRTTLRIKPPQEIFKSPEAMEFVISQIHNTASPDNLMQTYLDGKRPLNYGLEIVSIGGDVRFYINVPTKKTRNAVEAMLYSQYPGVEVTEEPVDYASELPLKEYEKEWEIMSFHMGKKDGQELPIKTYIDYGMDKLPKEELKVDPITPMLDVLGSIAPHERVYIQYIINPFRKSSFKNGQLMLGEGPNWTKGVEAKINDMMKRGGHDDDEKEPNPRLTGGERNTIETMERNANKYAYKTCIRWMYITKKGKFNGDIISPIIRSFSQYDLMGRNGIGVRWRTDFSYKDLIPGGKKHEIAVLKRQELKEYKLRKFFPKNEAGEPKIFTSEELATVFHLPGKVAMTPTLERIASTRAEAPPNLPTGNYSTN